MKITEKNRKVLSECFLFRSLTDPEIAELLEKKEAVSFPGGRAIYTPDRYYRSLGIVLEGEATVLKGEGTQLTTIRPGGCFGAAAMFYPKEIDGAPGEIKPGEYVTTVVAHKECKVFFVDGVELSEWFKQHPAMALDYIVFLSGRIRFLNQKIDTYTKRRAEDAIMDYLVSAADQQGIVTIRGGYAELARTLAVSRATLYRTLSLLESNGILEKNGMIIVLKKGAKRA